MDGTTGCIFPNARQCSARSKRSGCQCRAPAMAGKKVCLFHGGRAGAPAGPRNGQYRTGRYTAEAMARNRSVRQLIRMARALAAQMGG
jgi:hypothetical protein